MDNEYKKYKIAEAIELIMANPLGLEDEQGGTLTFQRDSVFVYTDKYGLNVDVAAWGWLNYYKWKIKKKPKWYDDIPEDGVLCRCTPRDTNTSKDTTVTLIFSKDIDGALRTDNGWEIDDYNVKPLTKAELQVYLDNAPEGE